VKDYKARIRTDSSAQTVLMQKNQHSHEPDERKNERHQLEILQICWSGCSSLEVPRVFLTVI
jgi:hypothetical protein